MLSSLLILMCGYCFCACDKRLLLTDQDVMQSIQSELQSLRQKIIRLENSQSRISVENTALKSELAHVNGQLATLQQTTEKGIANDIIVLSCKCLQTTLCLLYSIQTKFSLCTRMTIFSIIYIRCLGTKDMPQEEWHKYDLFR